MDDRLKQITEQIKQAFDRQIAWEQLPVRYVKTRNGWAGYRGATRITRWHFSEEGAREDVVAQEARNIPVR